MSRDLMRADEIKQMVRSVYRSFDGNTREAAERIYTADELSGIPEDAVRMSLGVANHMRYADVKEGETILDLGSGAGIDTIIAARRTGPSGAVLALDILPEMLRRARANAATAGVANAYVLGGDMEAIPLADESVDRVISNGVINLSARKSRVFAECARVLRPGGVFSVSDVTIVEEDLPAEVLVHPSAWAG